MFVELIIPSESTYAIEPTTRGITVLETFSSDQPPTFQNQPAYVDILDKVLILFLWHQNTCIFLSLSLSRVASSIYNFS